MIPQEAAEPESGMDVDFPGAREVDLCCNYPEVLEEGLGSFTPNALNEESTSLTSSLGLNVDIPVVPGGKER